MSKNYIIGIDPALSTSGIAVIDLISEEIIYAGKFKTNPKDDEDERINSLNCHILKIASEYKISEAVIEDGFIGNNMSTGIKLAMVRGGIISVLKYNGYIIRHMLPSEIRKNLGAGGNAKKEDVAERITKLYNDSEKLKEIGPYSDKQNKNKTSDIYDAIAAAVAYAKKKKTGGI